MVAIQRVSGHSLEPEYMDGDFILVVKSPLLFMIRRGDIIVFHHPEHGLMIKRVDHLEPGGETLSVVGTHPFSTDSRTFGAIPRRAVIGKVVWHIHP